MSLSGAANERALGRSILPLLHASFSLGTVLGAALGSLLLLFNIPLGVHTVGVGVFSIVVTLVLVRYLRRAGQEYQQPDHALSGGWRTRLGVWTDPRVLLIGLIVLGVTFAEGSANDWLSLAVVDGYHIDPAGGAAVFAVFASALTLTCFAGVKLPDRFGRVPVLRASAGIAALGLLLVIFGQLLPIASVGTVLWASARRSDSPSAFPPPPTTLAPRPAPSQPSATARSSSARPSSASQASTLASSTP